MSTRMGRETVCTTLVSPLLGPVDCVAPNLEIPTHEYRRIISILTTSRADRKDVNLDSSVWDDHDTNIHGNHSDFEEDEWYADGFSWPCCDRPGNNRGCIASRHKPSVSGRAAKRVKI